MLYLSLFEAHSSPPKPYGYRWGVLLHNYEHEGYQALCYAFGSAVSFSFECVVRICRYRYTDMFGLWAEIHCDNPGR